MVEVVASNSTLSTMQTSLWTGPDMVTSVMCDGEMLLGAIKAFPALSASGSPGNGLKQV